jgi:hypothetical protein
VVLYPYNKIVTEGDHYLFVVGNISDTKLGLRAPYTDWRVTRRMLDLQRFSQRFPPRVRSAKATNEREMDPTKKTQKLGFVVVVSNSLSLVFVVYSSCL